MPLALYAANRGAEGHIRTGLGLAGTEGKGQAQTPHFGVLERQGDFNNIIGEDLAK